MKKILNTKINFMLIIFLFPICILIGKYIRYYIMKSVLVDASIGYNWLSTICSNMSANEILKLTIAGEQNGSAILFYKFFNIFNISSYIGFEISISIIFNILLLIMFFKCRKNINCYQAIILILTIILLNLFCFCLSKEPIQILFFIAIYYILLSKTKKKELWSLLTIAISALIFRKYYILIVYFYLAAKIIINFITNTKGKRSTIKFLAIILLVGIGYLLILIISQKFFPTYYNEFIRVRTRVNDASTMIKNVFESENIILFVINYLIIVLRMLFPIELILQGPKYLLYVIYQLIISYSLIKNLVNYKKNSKEKNIAILIYIAFIFTSATFEPDFGSWIRHEIVLFPILMIINDITSEKQIKQKNDYILKK